MKLRLIFQSLTNKMIKKNKNNKNLNNKLLIFGKKIGAMNFVFSRLMNNLSTHIFLFNNL